MVLTMENKFNIKLAEQARKRRAMFYRLHTGTDKRKGKSCADLAKKFGVTRQCMSRHLILAKKDILGKQTEID